MYQTIGTLLLALGATDGRQVEPGRAAEILLASLQEEGFVSGELREELGGLSPREVPALFEILELGAVPVADGEAVELDDWRLEAVLSSFEQISPTAVRAHVRSLIGRPVPTETRETAARVLGAMGERQDVLTLVRVVAPVNPSDVLDRALEQAVSDALTRILARDKQAIWGLREAFDQCHERLLASIPRAIRAVHPPEGLQVLADLLGRAPAADALVLAEIGHFGENVNGVVDPMVLADVRAYLGQADARLVQGAALAVRKLDDVGAVPELLRLLRHPSANVRQSANLALERIADRRFRGDSSRWERWYNEQVHWLEREAEGLIADLRAGDKAVVASALNELATRRIFREELAAPLVQVLSHRDPGLVVLACSVVAKMGLRRAAPELTDLIEHRDPTLRGAARAALRRIRSDGGAGPLVVQR